MQRDTNFGKLQSILVKDGPMYMRWAKHLTTGALKYAPRNWMLASGVDEFRRFLDSAQRHFDYWMENRLMELQHWEDSGEFAVFDGVEDEAAATFFNMNGAEYVRTVQ